MLASTWLAKASFSSMRSSSAGGEPGARERLAHGRDRPDAHHRGLDAGDGARDDRGADRQAVPARA